MREEEYLKLKEYHVSDSFKVGMGAEVLLQMIKNLDLKKLAAKLRKKIRCFSKQSPLYMAV